MALQSQPDGAPAPAPRQVLVLACAGVVLASLDLFIVNVALPQIAVDLGEPDLGRLSWVLNAYAIVYASLLVLFGRLADRYRRDRAFALGIALFTVASAACAAAGDLTTLVLFRVVQAAGAALLTPTSLGLVLAAYPPHRRAGAVRAWTASGGAAAALGPVLGGLLVEVGWRWVFLVNVPVGLVGLVLARRRLPAVPGHPTQRPDVLGAGLVTVGTAALTLGLVQGRDRGWTSPLTVAELVGGALLLTAFAVHCARGRAPLVPPELFSARAFRGATVVMATFSAAFAVMLLLVVLWLQDVRGWSPLVAGLALAPGPLMVPVVSFGVGGPLVGRFGAGPVALAGNLFLAAALAWWAVAAPTSAGYATAVLPGMLASGVGVGLTLPTLMAAAASSLPPAAFATGSAVISMVRQTGMALGVAVAVAVLGRPVGADATAQAFHNGWWVGSAFALLAAAGAAVLLRSAAPAAAGAADRPTAPTPSTLES